MILPLSQSDDVYRKIRTYSLRTQQSVLVLVSPDVDSLCASKILLTLFKTDYIQYKLIPVSSYDELSEINETYIQGKDDMVTSIVLINCGGAVDLTEFLSLSSHMTVYIMDSHRPIHLSNLYADQQVQVLDDGELQAMAEQLWPAFEAIEIGTQATEDHAEEEHVEKDLEDVDNGDDDRDDDDDDHDDDHDRDRDRDTHYDAQEDNKENQQATSMKPNMKPKSESKRESKRHYRRQIIDYYKHTWVGSSVSSFTYAIAGQLQKANNDLLWNCVIGITSQYISHLIDEDKYAIDVELLQVEVNRFNPIEGPGLAAGSEDVLSLVSSNEAASEALSSYPGENPYGRIQLEEEYRFILTRHWTLYQSMLHSSYIASKFHTWTEKGRRRLETFLAKMGLPLSEANQPFTFVDPSSKKRLRPQLERYGAEEGLDEPVYASFTRKLGYKLKLSASDEALILRALLSSPVDLSPEAARSLSLADVRKRNFYTALDALDVQSVELLTRGLQLAKLQSQRLLKMATNLLTHRMIKNLKTFRLGTLAAPAKTSSSYRHAGAESEQASRGSGGGELDEEEYWSHPLSLASLAAFITEAQKARDTHVGKLPLVLASLSLQRKQYLVIGHLPRTESTESDARKNYFGTAFRKAAEETQVRIHFDGFDSWSLYLDANDLTRFMQFLQSVLVG